MADAAVRLYGPAQLGTSAATLYTVPADTQVVLRSLHVANTTGTDRTFTLSVGADAVGTRVYSAITVPGNGTLEWNGFIPLAAAEILQGYASAGSALTLIAAGIAVTA